MHLPFIDNIRGAYQEEMQLISKFNKVFILLKDKKGITITIAFQKALNRSKHKPNKIWEDKGSEFYNR